MVTLVFEISVYTTSESRRRVVVCAAVIAPSVGCPSTSPFSVSLLFLPGTAGNITRLQLLVFRSCICDDANVVVTDSSDYVSEPQTLDFSSCSRRCCATINIVNDIQVEEDEFFNVFLQSSNQQLTLNSSSATIEINNDNDGRYVVLCIATLLD